MAPAVLTVLNTADSGAGSLREAVQVANADASSGISDTINFDASLAGATISLTGELFLHGGKIDGSTPGGSITLSGSFHN